MIKTLHLYNRRGTWLFDDAEKQIVEEPFVEGSSEIITEIQKRTGYSGDGISLTFSDLPFPTCQHIFTWKGSRDEGTWNLYRVDAFQMGGWLCPVLLRYFDKAPEKLYVSIAGDGEVTTEKPDLQVSKKKIVYVDMDGVLVDFQSSFENIDAKILEDYKDNKDDIPHIFSLMVPMSGAVEAFQFLSEHFDTYILSTAPWNNPSAWSDKLEWVKLYLGEAAKKRLILTHHKNLNRGDYLIDDRTKHGACSFGGILIQFGTAHFPDWKSVIAYLEKRIEV
jgi:hypothetical protein